MFRKAAVSTSANPGRALPGCGAEPIATIFSDGAAYLASPARDSRAQKQVDGVEQFNLAAEDTEAAAVGLYERLLGECRSRPLALDTSVAVKWHLEE